MIQGLLIILSFLLPVNDSLEEKINEYLNQALSGYDRFEYEIVKKPESYTSIKIIDENRLNLVGDLIYIPVEIVNNRKAIRSYVTVRAKIYQDVYIASKKIDRKKSFSFSDFYTENIDVASIKGTPVMSMTDLEEYRSRIDLNPGDILIEEFMEKSPIIHNGDPLKADFENGYVSIKMEAFAREEGSEGDVIRIVTRDKKNFKAKVIDSNNVLIIE